MNDIDFLPVGYRQPHAKRNVQLWRVVVIVGFLGLLSMASLVQYYRLCRARAQLDQLAIQHAAAELQNNQLAHLQAEFKETTGNAELFTYLRHPWPRTQVLAALLAPLPDSVVLQKLEIIIDEQKMRSQNKFRPGDVENAEGGNEPEPPASRDLTELRQRLDTAKVMAVLSGRTTDPAALHRYLGELNRCPLFAKAELDSLESVNDTPNEPEGTMVFTAVVLIRPGYGQPNGPVGARQVALAPDKRLGK